MCDCALCTQSMADTGALSPACPLAALRAATVSGGRQHDTTRQAAVPTSVSLSSSSSAVLGADSPQPPTDSAGVVESDSQGCQCVFCSGAAGVPDDGRRTLSWMQTCPMAALQHASRGGAVPRGESTPTPAPEPEKTPLHSSPVEIDTPEEMQEMKGCSCAFCTGQAGYPGGLCPMAALRAAS